MGFLTLFFSISLILYALILAFFYLGLFKKSVGDNRAQPFVTVVIPAKNEMNNIEKILSDLTNQTYPTDLYEINVVDDESTDVTSNIVHAWIEKHSNIFLYNTSEYASDLKYKKKPLDLGIKKAKGEIILLTDADCRVPKTWIESIVSYFEPTIGLVVGYSEVSPTTTRLQEIEALDFQMLLTAARGAVTQNIPFACTGQNLAYLKKAFEDVGGFSSFAHALGGDDNLLMQQIKKSPRWNIVFAYDHAGFVTSPPQSNFRGFISQRARWASDTFSIKNDDSLFFGIIVITFFVNFLPLAITLNLLWSPFLLVPLIKGLAFKFLCEGIVMLRGTQVFDKKELRRIFPLWFFFQIPYITLMGFMSFRGKHLSWGGRQT